jgi:hypothetical protein
LRQPAEALGQLQPVAVARAQLDDADAVELRQRLDQLRLGQVVGGEDFLGRHLAHDADRHHQQRAVGDHGLLLCQRQLQHQRLGVGHAPRQVGEIQPQHAADVVDARDRHVAAAAEHALDAGLGHAELLRQPRVGDAGSLEFGLEQGDQVGGGAHVIPQESIA